MPTRLIPLAPHKGFTLEEEIIFEGNLCIFIGKNGTGKTRLIEAIDNGKIKITDKNGETAHTRQVIKLDEKSITFNIIGDENIPNNLAKGIFEVTQSAKDLSEIPEELRIHIDNTTQRSPPPKFNAVDIVNRATQLFKKEISSLTIDEIKLSISIYNEQAISILEEDGSSKASLSQLTTNYFLSKRQNLWLKFLSQGGQNVSPLDDKSLEDAIGESSPRDIFNKILSDLFRGKFTLSEASDNNANVIYKPKLLLKKGLEPIELNDLSSGEKTIFGLALRIFENIWSIPISKNINSKIILFDEPDSHLHPQMVLDFYKSLEALSHRLNVKFIFSTHSPTTVALAPCPNIFNIESDVLENTFKVELVNKDRAISELLEGASQITIDYENARQIFVENENDSATYEIIYTSIKNNSTKLNKNIKLSFISSGPKISRSEIEKHIKSILREIEKPLLDSIVDKINGSGSCEQVISHVEYLTEKGNKSVRGLIDWDGKNRENLQYIVAGAKDYAYSIENIIYDPISIFALCLTKNFKPASHFFSCEDDYHWHDALSDTEKLQSIVDQVTVDVIGRKNKRDHEISYMGGITLKGDKEYFIPKEGTGHTFESLVLKNYACIYKIHNRSSNKPLIFHFIQQATIGLLSWRFINTEFEKTFCELQK